MIHHFAVMEILLEDLYQYIAKVSSLVMNAQREMVHVCVYTGACVWYITRVNKTVT